MTLPQVKSLRRQNEVTAWVLHCIVCRKPEGQCAFGAGCSDFKNLWHHTNSCWVTECNFPRYVLQGASKGLYLKTWVGA